MKAKNLNQKNRRIRRNDIRISAQGSLDHGSRGFRAYSNSEVEEETEDGHIHTTDYYFHRISQEVDHLRVTTFFPLSGLLGNEKPPTRCLLLAHVFVGNGPWGISFPG
ncbi:hypothetical protein Dimus_019558 [Dionaea muscipula]